MNVRKPKREDKMRMKQNKQRRAEIQSKKGTENKGCVTREEIKVLNK